MIACYLKACGLAGPTPPRQSYSAEAGDSEIRRRPGSELMN